jgi:leucyl/phenylalanyl-tRNA--protein transferase
MRARRLSAEIVVAGYRRGMFPMAESRDGPIFWLSPDPRAVLPLDAFHCPRRLAQTLRSGKFRATTDAAFEAVIDGCADRPDTWISAEVREAYVDLARRGVAHSVEVWEGRTLAGGTYGVHLGGAFMAESKFHARRDASKAALAALVGVLRGIGVTLLDVQFVTPHLARFGVVEIPRREYLRRLEAVVGRHVPWPTAGPIRTGF